MTDPEGEWAKEPRVSRGAENPREHGARSPMSTTRRAEFAEAQHRLIEARLKHCRLQIARARIGIALKLGLLAALLFAALLLVLLVISASRSERVVIEAFDVPEALASNGATGEALAASVADEFVRLEGGASAADPLRRPQGAEVQPSGLDLSLGAFHRLVAAQIGHDRQVSGSVLRTSDGMLRLTLRGQGVTPKTFTAPSRYLPELAERAGGYLFGLSDPQANLLHLNRQGRSDAASDFAATAFQQASGSRDRSAIARLWADALAGEGRYREAQERARLAISLNPRNWNAYSTLAAASSDEQESLAASRWFRQRATAAPAGDRPSSTLFANEYRLMQDWSALAALSGNKGEAASSALRALAEAYRHDHRRAARLLALAAPGDPLLAPMPDLLFGLRELDLGRADRAVASLQRFNRATSKGPLRRYFRAERCHLALAYARIGRTREALRMLISEEPNSRCRAYRADALALGGEWKAAQQAYRVSFGATPSLPLPRERAAAALLAREEPEAAIRLFRDAIALGVNWADPRFGLAEALMELGRFGEAEREYRSAAPLAPRWGALHIGWGEALWRTGRQPEARKVWQAAAGMDLSAAHGARLRQLLAFPVASEPGRLDQPLPVNGPERG